MSLGALIMMICTISIVTGFTSYFFFKILKSPISTEEQKEA